MTDNIVGILVVIFIVIDLAVSVPWFIIMLNRTKKNKKILDASRDEKAIVKVLNPEGLRINDLIFRKYPYTLEVADNQSAQDNSNSVLTVALDEGTYSIVGNFTTQKQDDSETPVRVLGMGIECSLEKGHEYWTELYLESTTERRKRHNDTREVIGVDELSFEMNDKNLTAYLIMYKEK
ncbi:hypothetical protein EJ419_01240 [Alloscardovia theropitheci]|uniref:Uncharacterized protein n=1 Tax=Alloscardovia theropitheci TaxID=2496842 RepID=A0A4R0QWH7_9BIFI|nr:hypothetical protein [Alloscardovia theropitheci]TCD54757.1 hypothetical protein EJ419_01240 [Alloscardovia theropitheci]